MHHSDIIGKWKIIRYIEDKLNQKNFELLGSATFVDKNSLYQFLLLHQPKRKMRQKLNNKYNKINLKKNFIILNNKINFL